MFVVSPEQQQQPKRHRSRSAAGRQSMPRLDSMEFGGGGGGAPRGLFGGGYDNERPLSARGGTARSHASTPHQQQQQQQQKYR